MSSPRAHAPVVALFDLDGTLTRRDTLLPFLAGYAARHPSRLLRLWRIAPALIEFAAGRDRGRLKSQAIRAVMGADARDAIESWAQTFVEALRRQGRFHARGLEMLESHRAAGDHLVLLSASPDLYVPLIGRMLRFERTLCTEVRWNGERLDGALATENRRGEEKVRCLEWLRREYPGARVIAYGNSASDLAHLERADGAVLVNGSAAARRQAAGAGIASERWR
jgi:phosphatidylglycerophosphatase C